MKHGRICLKVPTEAHLRDSHPTPDEAFRLQLSTVKGHVAMRREVLAAIPGPRLPAALDLEDEKSILDAHKAVDS